MAIGNYNTNYYSQYYPYIGDSYQYDEWVVARAYPPNGVMPSISTGSENPWPP